MTTTAAALLRAGEMQLAYAGIPDPKRDARRLLAFAWDCPASHLTLRLAEPISDEVQRQFQDAIEARATFRPVSQIIGKRLFFDLEFIVTGDVLDPRPETEVLVAAALERPFLRCLDLGTGSGCILLSLLAAAPYATGVGLDQSKAALHIARANAETLDLDERAEFIASDWFASAEGQFDLIVSNPPYISGPEFAALSRDVARFEPKGALTPGPEGLEAYRKIAEGIATHLKPGGRAYFEIGPTQAEEVVAIFQEAGLRHLETRADLDNRPRCVIFQMPEGGGV